MTPTDDTINRRVLVIDDNPAIHDDFRKVLGAPSPAYGALDEQEEALFGQAPSGEPVIYDIDTAGQGESGTAMAQAAREGGRPYAVAFVDMRMPPGWDGVQTIEHLWEHDDEIQVVICTAYSDYSVQQIQDRLGRSDRLLILKKPFDNAEVIQLALALTEKWNLARLAHLKARELEELVLKRTSALRRYTRKLRRAQHELRRLSKRLADVNAALAIEARIDPLTEVFNRRAFDEIAAITDAGARRLGHSYGVVMIDIDWFKSFNDAAGHQRGDACLRRVARRLRTAARAMDVVGRFGGEEFVVMAPACGPAEAQGLADRLVEAVRREGIEHPGRPSSVGHEVGAVVTVSAGVAVGPGDSLAQTIERADHALYQAKAAGRDRVAFAA
jgi:diguanylate cyclase (GGDEF)-like protein